PSRASEEELITKATSRGATSFGHRTWAAASLIGPTSGKGGQISRTDVPLPCPPLSSRGFLWLQPARSQGTAGKYPHTQTRWQKRWPPGSQRASVMPHSSWWTMPSSRWTAQRPRSTCTSSTRTGGGAETHTTTTVKIGRRHRGSQLHSWTAAPTKHSWILIIIWTTFGATGQTRRSTKQFCTCARQGPHYSEDGSIFLHL
ncbi:COX4 neighbor, isoform CRA_a, partial [Mus musculus]